MLMFEKYVTTVPDRTSIRDDSKRNRGEAMAIFRCVALALVICALVAGCERAADRAGQYQESGMRLLASGDPVKASLQFQNALQLSPSLHTASYGLALAAEQQGDWPAMWRHLDQTLEQAPSFWRAHLKKGQLLLAAGHSEAALKAAEGALLLAPTSPEALALRAAIALHAADGDSARRFASAALEKEEVGIEPLVLLARERSLAGDHAAALDYAAQALAREPANIGLALLQAKLLEAKGSGAEATAHYKELYRRQPEHRAPLRALVRHHLESGDVAAAEALLRTHAATYPDVDVVLELVALQAETVGPDAAIAELDRFAPVLKPDDRLTWRRIEMELARGSHAVAAAQLEAIGEASAERPRDAAQAKGLLGLIRLEQGRRAQAQRLVDEALALDAGAPGVRLAAGSAALAGQRPEAAVGLLRAAVADAPGEPHGHRLLAKAYEMLGSPALAEEHYREAIEQSRFASDQVGPYAEFLLKTGRTEAAQRVILRAQERGPLDTALVALLARISIHSGDKVAALGIADQLAASGNDEAAARVRFAVGVGESVDESDKRSSSIVATSAEGTLAARAEALLRQGRGGEADALVEAALAATPDDAGPLLLKAWLLQVRGEQRAAMELVRRGIEDYPGDPAAYLALSRAYLQTGDLPAAEAVLEQGRSALPRASELLLAMAQLLELTGRTEAAVAAYEQLLVELPQADIVVNNLAALLLDGRKDAQSLQRAWGLARRFQHSSVPEFLDTAGWASYRTGRFNEAVELLEQARKLAPDAAVVRYHLGLAYAAVDRTEAARRELELARSGLDTTGTYRKLAAEALQTVRPASEPTG